MKAYILAVVIAIIGLQVPAFAVFNIPQDLPKQPILKQPAFTAKQKKADWVAVIPKQNYSIKSIIVNSKPVSPVIIDNKNSWTNVSRANKVIQNDYVKSDFEVKLMNQVYRNPGSQLVTGEVPEPGSIVGLSAGVVGFLFQFRRSKKRA